MLLLRGVIDSGKTTTLQQALCNAGAEDEAIYIAMRPGNQIRSYDELCRIFEEALAHLDVERPNAEEKGEERFRTILNNIKRYQARVKHRIMVLDDVHAMKYMGSKDSDFALGLIKEATIDIQKLHGTRVVYTSSDGLFMDQLVRKLALRANQVRMGSVPLDECMKHVVNPERLRLRSLAWELRSEHVWNSDAGM